jgi:sulfite exporter TauE/SafE
MDLDSTILSVLAAGVAECRAAVQTHGGLFTSLFLAGLLGSMTHCVGMCGPFVVGQVVSRLEARPAAEMREFHRLAGAALVPYHFGRATTYAGLGAAAAALAGGLINLTGLRWLSAGLLILAALFFAGYGLQRLGLVLPWRRASGESALTRALSRVARPLFARPTGWRGYGLGLALGFLPCGLLYGALAAAAASAGPLSGALGMLAFAAGTVPALVAVGLAGHVAGRTWQPLAMRLMPAVMLINAAALGYLAWRTIA